MDSRRSISIGRRPRLKQLERASEELHKVTTRALIYKAMTICPMVFLGAIGVHSRLSYESFSPQACNPSQQQQITAYVEPVRLVSALSGEKSGDTQYARSVAKQWILQAQEGKLKALLPLHASDSLGDGIKRQIKEAADKVQETLTDEARASIASGRYDEAAKDLVLAVRFVDILKYSDFATVSSEGLRQRWMIRTLHSISGHLKENTKAELRKQLASVPVESDPIRDLALVYKKHLELNAQKEREIAEAGGAEPQMQLTLHSKQVDAIINPQLRRALQAQELYRKSLGKAMQELADHKA